MVRARCKPALENHPRAASRTVELMSWCGITAPLAECAGRTREDGNRRVYGDH